MAETSAPTNHSEPARSDDVVSLGELAQQYWAQLLLLVGFLPLLVIHFANLWARPQYQHFPFIIGIVGFLVYTRFKPIPDGLSGPVRRKRAYAMIGFSLVILSAGTLAFSPWFAALGFAFAAGGIILLLRERYELQNAFGIWLLICLLIPVPAKYEEKLSQALQRLTTVVSGELLELVRVPNIVEGVTLDIASRRLFIEEACSGIVSMMAIVASCLIVAVLSNRALIHTIFLVLSGIAWAAVTNVLRIVTIGIGLRKLNVDLSEGWQHDVLGLVLFAVALLMAISTDRLLAFFLAPVETEEGGVPSWLTVAWDRVVGWLDPLVPGLIESKPPENEAPLSLSQMPFVALAGVFLMLGTVSLARGIYRVNKGDSVTFAASTGPLTDAMDADFMPETIGPWKRIDFQESHKERLFAQESRVWTYQNEDLVASFAMDFSFPSWHDLCVCYGKIGWSQNDAARTRQAEGHMGGDFVEAEFFKENSEEAALYFSLIEHNGQEFAPPETLNWMGELRRRLEPDKTLYQIQLFASEVGDLSNRDRKQAEDLYLACRDRVVQHITKSGATPTEAKK